jgi:hypothetical protein
MPAAVFETFVEQAKERALTFNIGVANAGFFGYAIAY